MFARVCKAPSRVSSSSIRSAVQTRSLQASRKLSSAPQRRTSSLQHACRSTTASLIRVRTHAAARPVRLFSSEEAKNPKADEEEEEEEAGDPARRQELVRKYGPALQIEGPAGEAATALYVRAGMDDAHNKVEPSVARLLDEIKTNDSLRSLLQSSADSSDPFTEEEIEQFTAELQADLELDPLMSEFVEYVWRVNLLHDLGTVLDNFLKMVWHAKKEVHGTLTCVSEDEARELAGSAEFNEIAAEHLPSGFKLVLDYNAAPSLLAGFRLSLPDRILELSLADLIAEPPADPTARAKRVLAAVEALPMFVEPEVAAAEARQYATHSLASVVKLKETYGA